jgi:TolA-binding protein
MSNGAKLGIYLALALLAGVSGFFAFARFKSLINTSRFQGVETENAETNSAEVAATSSVPVIQTNSATTNLTNIVETNAPALAAAVTNATNAVIAPASTNNAGATTFEEKSGKTGGTVATALGSGSIGPKKKGGRMGVWMGIFVLSVAGLGLMLARDVSQFFGNRALRVIYNDDLEGISNPEYENAEQLWANGQHLEAIRLMREYLNKNPREQHVALRIAEIYEKDLGNDLAAALEYEEVLKHKLPAERWGWAAIHLCNLYFRLNQEQKAFALLRRLVKEHPKTPAAEKARKRLEQVDAMMSPEIPTESQVSSSPGFRKRGDEAASNLPPGFRPKKS